MKVTKEAADVKITITMSQEELDLFEMLFGLYDTITGHLEVKKYISDTTAQKLSKMMAEIYNSI